LSKKGIVGTIQREAHIDKNILSVKFGSLFGKHAETNIYPGKNNKNGSAIINNGYVCGRKKNITNNKERKSPSRRSIEEEATAHTSYML